MRKIRGKSVKRLKRFSNPVTLALILTILVYFIVRVSPSGELDTIDEYWLLTGAFVAYLVLGLLFNKINHTRFSARSVVVSTPEDLEARLYDLSQVLGDAGRTLRDIEIEILARESAARKLTIKTEQLRSTAEMREDDAKQIGEFLAQKIDERLREMNQQSRKTTWASFAYGVIVSIPIGVFINVLVR